MQELDSVKKWIIKYNAREIYDPIEAAKDPELGGVDLWSIYGGRFR